MQYNLIVVLGPTASGKTRLGVQLARQLRGEIISADSRQVYRGLDLGAGKDLSEYEEVSCHLIDIVDPGHEFNVFEYQRRFFEVFNEISRRGALPILVGGTGMYLDSVLRGYRLVPVPENPQLRNELAPLTMDELAARFAEVARPHNTTDTLDRNRLVRAIEIALHERSHEPEPLPPVQPVIFGIRWERSILRRRITDRLRERLAEGLVAEVQGLLDSGVSHQTLEFYGLEYRFISRHLRGDLTFNDMFQKLNSAIHDFAKRQETWFRRMERNGTVINWLAGGHDLLEQALSVLTAWEAERD